MVYVCRCRRVAVRDVALLNAPYWTLFLFGCEDVTVRGVTIRNPATTPNGDGIDIDCSRNVRVSDCRIESGDDALTIRANPAALPDPMPCENVAVSNCLLSSPACAVRVGVGNGTIRHCALGNLVIPAARHGIHLVCRYASRT